MNEETEETGPIQKGIWDTRNRENSRWCSGCNRWLRLSTFSWFQNPDDALRYHQREYCVKHPNYNPQDQ